MPQPDMGLDAEVRNWRCGWNASNGNWDWGERGRGPGTRRTEPKSPAGRIAARPRGPASCCAAGPRAAGPGGRLPAARAHRIGRGLRPDRRGDRAGVRHALAGVGRAHSGRRGRLEAALHSLTSVLVLCPLLWEATLRFHAISTWTAGAILLFFTLFGLAVSWRKNLLLVATIATLAGLGQRGGAADCHARRAALHAGVSGDRGRGGSLRVPGPLAERALAGGHRGRSLACWPPGW